MTAPCGRLSHVFVSSGAALTGAPAITTALRQSRGGMRVDRRCWSCSRARAGTKSSVFRPLKQESAEPTGGRPLIVLRDTDARVGGGPQIPTAGDSYRAPSRMPSRHSGTPGTGVVPGSHHYQRPGPQTFWAFWNAGDWGLSPGPPIWMPLSLPLNVGSGGVGTPCLRMHCALAIAASFWLSGIGGLGALPPASSLSHDWSADWKAGDCGLTLEGMTMPSKVLTGPLGVLPFEIGSGRFGTPCERMQTTNFSFCV